MLQRVQTALEFTPSSGTPGDAAAEAEPESPGSELETARSQAPQPEPEPQPSPSVPSSHVSATPSSAAVMPSIIMPTTGFSLESEPDGGADG